MRCAVRVAPVKSSRTDAGSSYRTDAGNMSPAGRVRQRLLTSHAVICRCWAAVNRRSSIWTARPPSETARPSPPATAAARALRPVLAVVPRRPCGGGRPGRAACGGRGPALSASGSAGGTTEWYGVLPPPKSPLARQLRPVSARGGSVLVGRQGGIDLLDPGEHAAADVHGVGEPGVLRDRQAFGAALAALAVQHELLVLRQLAQCLAGQELPLGDEMRAGDGDDLVLVRLPDVHDEDVLARVHHGLQVARADRRAGRGLLGLVRYRAAELLVVDQPGDRRVLAADRALGVLLHPDRAVAHLQGVVDHQPADERLADPGDDLD